MAPIFSLILLAASLAPDARALRDDGATDRLCYRVMADFAAHDDRRISRVAEVAAHYFLGRIDTASSGFDPEAAPSEPLPEAERQSLLERCGDVMGAAGHDFRALAAAPDRPSI